MSLEETTQPGNEQPSHAGKRGRAIVAKTDDSSVPVGGEVAKGLKQRREELRAAALAYGQAGYRIFPCFFNRKTRRKPPHKGLSAHKATTDPDVIEAWWKEWPDALIGLATGEPVGGGYGLEVLDLDLKTNGDKKIDGHENVPNWEKHSLITETWSGGHHLFYRWSNDTDIRNWAGRGGGGVDCRTTGGYVIVPPSYFIVETEDETGNKIDVIHEYKPFKGDLLNPPELLGTFPTSVLMRAKSKGPVVNDPGKRPRGKPKKDSEGSGNHALAQSWLRRLADKLALEEEGGRNQALNDAAYQLGPFVRDKLLTRPAVEAALREACVKNGLAKDGDKPIERTIASGLESGVAKATLPALWDLPQFADQVLAEEFAELHRDDLAYVPESKKYRRWDGQRWIEFKETVQAWNIIGQFCREKAKTAKEQSVRHILLSMKKIAAIEPLVRGQLIRSADDFDKDLWLLNTPTGIVDLRTGELSDHDPLKLMTKMTAVGPADEANCPSWLEFLYWAMQDDEEMVSYLQRIAGYGLTGDTSEQAFFFLYGGGGNGKNTFVDVLKEILNDYSKTAHNTTFTSNSKNDKHPTDVAGLMGARVVSSNEIDKGRSWDESKLKEHTGGGKVTARFMRGDFFEYEPRYKLIISGNEKPRLRDVGQSMRRRLNLIPWLENIEGTPERKIKHLYKKLVADEGASILRWFIDGCLEWQQLKGLAPPQKVIEQTDEYFEDEDLVGQWLNERTIKDPLIWTATERLYTDFSRWAESCGDRPMNMGQFGKELAKRNFKGSLSGKPKKRGYDGIRLNIEDDLQRASANEQEKIPY